MHSKKSILNRLNSGKKTILEKELKEHLNRFSGNVFWPKTKKNKESKNYLKTLKKIARANYNLANRRPSLILQPKSVQDVVIAVKIIKEFKKKNLYGEVPATVIGGGHSDISCLDDAVLIHMKSMSSVHSFPDKKEVVVGAGATLGDVNKAVSNPKLNLACPLGTYPTVGIGLVLQGGFGNLTRKYSLAVDNIKEVEIVCPDEKIKKIASTSTGEERELFWAVCGAGPCFGIVTQVTLRVYPLHWIYHAETLFEINIFGNDLEYLYKCEQYIRALPDHQKCDMVLSYKNSRKKARIELFLLSLKDEPFETGFIDLLDLSDDDIKRQAYHEQLKVLSERFEEQKYGSYVRSAFVDEIGVEGWKIFMTGLKKMPGNKCLISLQQAGGEARRKRNTSFYTRNIEFSVSIMAMWKPGDNAHREKYEKWADNLWNNLKTAGICIGTYAVDIDPLRRKNMKEDEADLAFGTNLPKLRRVKNKIDPDNIFRGKYL